MLSLMDVKVPGLLKLLNIMVAIISGFTVYEYEGRCR